jgi:repressor LexA
MKKITQRQQTVLEIISTSIKDKGYPPTLKELADSLGVSSRNSAVKHLTALAKKGYILWEKNKARGIKLLEKAGGIGTEQEARLPLVGAVTAGVPMLAEENIERYVSVPRSLVKNIDQHFLLKVQGESMKDAGILDKDLVIVRSQAAANPGDVVVALIENEATVKRLAEKEGRIFLKAENPDFSNIYPDGEWSVQGRVVALLRENIE